MGALFEGDSLRRSWGLFHVVSDETDLRFRLDPDLRRRGPLADLRSWLFAGRVLIVPAVPPMAIQRRDRRRDGDHGCGLGLFLARGAIGRERELLLPRR